MTKEDWKKQQGGTAIQPLLAGKTCMEPPWRGRHVLPGFGYIMKDSVLYF